MGCSREDVLAGRLEIRGAGIGVLVIIFGRVEV